MTTVHVLLEGDDDERFFHAVLRPQLAKTHSTIKTYQYAQRSKKEIERYVHNLHATNQPYIVLADFDSKSACYSGRKDILRGRIYPARPVNMAIVKTEIESWYLAGMGQPECESMQIPYHPNTEPISKEEFDQMRMRSGSGAMPRSEFMKRMLVVFDAKRAKMQNTSFGYVWDKFVSKAA